MKFPSPLLEGTFLSRSKRFFADIHFHGEVITAHVPNSGSMKGCNTPGSACLFSLSPDPNRKLKYTLEAIQAPSGCWIGVNTARPNALVEEAFTERHIQEWGHYSSCAREVKISDESRVDLVFWEHQLDPVKGKPYRPTLDDIRSPQRKFHFVEVKNVSLAEKSRALFPDSVTTRGQKHIRELVGLMKLGHSAEFVFVIQRTDIDSFSAAHEIDPDYARLLKDAVRAGLKVSPYIWEMTPAGLELRPSRITHVI